MLELVESADRLARWMLGNIISEKGHRDALLILNIAQYFVAVSAPTDGTLRGVAQEAEHILDRILYPEASC